MISRDKEGSRQTRGRIVHSAVDAPTLNRLSGREKEKRDTRTTSSVNQRRNDFT